MAVLTFLTYLRGVYELNLAKSSPVHNAVIQSVYDAFLVSKDDIDLMKLELTISTATGIWLDSWGDFFSVYRNFGESDRNFSQRIISSVISPKSTLEAIRLAVFNYLKEHYGDQYTEKDVVIREPWKQLSKYSQQGQLSNTARMYSPTYYTHAVIEINIPESVTDDLIEIVKYIKAAGVKVYWSVLNQYDPVTGFSESDDSFAYYLRRFEPKLVNRKQDGLTLSSTSASSTLSGNQELWEIINRIFPYYVERATNWLFGTPLITIQDLFDRYVKDDGTEYTLGEIYEAEDTYYNGYFTFGDKNQAPIVVVQTPI